MSVAEQASLGDLLKWGRTGKGFRQADIAHKIGVTQATWSLWERGDSFPSDTNIPAIAAELDLAPQDLLAAKERSGIDRKLKSLESTAATASDQDAADDERPVPKFVKSSLDTARERLGDDLVINIVGPETLPFLDEESIRAEWAENILNGATYNLVWFLDSLAFNNSDKSFTYNRVTDVLLALDDLETKIDFAISRKEEGVERKSDLSIKHYFVWSGLFDYEFARDSVGFKIACKRVARFISGLAETKRPDARLANKVVLVNSPLQLVGEAQLQEWIEAQLVTTDKAAMRLRQIGSNIAGRFWCNRDLLVVFIDAEGLEEPYGYNIPRRGYRSLDEVLLDQGMKSDGVPRALRVTEGRRALNLINELQEFEPQHQFLPLPAEPMASPALPSKETTA